MIKNSKQETSLSWACFVLFGATPRDTQNYSHLSIWKSLLEVHKSPKRNAMEHTAFSRSDSRAQSHE